MEAVPFETNGEGDEAAIILKKVPQHKNQKKKRRWFLFWITL